MDKNTWIGFLLIAAIIVGFSMINRPSKEEMAERQRINDSIALVRQMEWEAQQLSEAINEQQSAVSDQQSAVSEQQSAEELADRLQVAYGDFAVSAQGNEDFTTLENERVRLTFTTKGGRLYRAELKEYKAYGDTVNDLHLFTGDESNLAFTLITANNRIISTQNLYYEPIKKDSVLTMRLKTAQEDAYLDFVYTLPSNEYMWHFDIVPHNMERVLAQNVSTVEMQWKQKVPQQEKGRKFEERYSQLQYMDISGDVDNLSEQKSSRKKEPVGAEILEEERSRQTALDSLQRPVLLDRTDQREWFQLVGVGVRAAEQIFGLHQGVQHHDSAGLRYARAYTAALLYGSEPL